MTTELNYLNKNYHLHEVRYEVGWDDANEAWAIYDFVYCPAVRVAGLFTSPEVAEYVTKLMNDALINPEG